MALHVPGRFFLIAFVPVIIFAQEAMISGQLMDTALPVSADILGPVTAEAEASGRFRFLAATWMFAALGFMVFAMAVRDLTMPLTRETRLAGAAVLVGIVAIAMSPTLGYMQDPDVLRNYDRLGGEVFRTAFAQGRVPGCAGPEDRWLLGACGEVPVISLLNRMMDVINLFAGLGVGGLTVGMILCLKNPTGDGLEARAQMLERNMLRMRRQLYLSGLVLTFGIFYVISWMRWPLPMVAAAHADAYGAMISSALLYTGVYFSLLILSFYLPVALILEGRKERLAADAAQHESLKDDKARKAWLEMRGLKAQPVEVLKSGLALLAPILTAFAGSFPSLL